MALVVVLALVASACDVVDTGPEHHHPRRAAGSSEPAAATHPAEVAAGVQVVTIAASWNSAEPTQGTFSTHYADQINAKINAARAAGLDVILDPGMQYTPAWVFHLKGGTRFVNQYGDVFTGPAASGNNVANAVTNMTVRTALNGYLTWLGGPDPQGGAVGRSPGWRPAGRVALPGRQLQRPHRRLLGLRRQHPGGLAGAGLEAGHRARPPRPSPSSMPTTRRSTTSGSG